MHVLYYLMAAMNLASHHVANNATYIGRGSANLTHIYVYTHTVQYGKWDIRINIRTYTLLLTFAHLYTYSIALWHQRSIKIIHWLVATGGTEQLLFQ